MALGKKTGGRQKGEPNKDHANLVNLFDEENYEPAREAIEAIRQLPPELAAPLHVKMMKFKYSERKAIEHSGEIDTSLFNDLLGLDATDP